MKFLATLLLIASAISVNAQDPKLRFGLQIFPNFSTGIPAKGAYNSDYHKGFTSAAFSGSLGFQLERDLGQKWVASAGLLYKFVRENGKIIPADPYRGFLYPQDYDFTLGYVEVQLNTVRKIGENWAAEAGISPAWLAEGIYTTYLSDYAFKVEEYERNPFALNINLGFGFRRETDKMNLRAMPYAQLDAFKALKGSGAYYYGYPAMRFFSLGLRTTITF